MRGGRWNSARALPIQLMAELQRLKLGKSRALKTWEKTTRSWGGSSCRGRGGLPLTCGRARVLGPKEGLDRTSEIGGRGEGVRVEAKCLTSNE